LSKPTASATIGHVHERNPGQAQVIEQGIGVAGILRTAISRLHLAPLQTGVGERRAHRLRALRHARMRMAAEGVQADAADGDARAHAAASGSKANTCTGLPSGAWR
jgi:hypothetical protein